MDTRVDNGVLAVLDRVTRTIKNIDIYFFKQAHVGYVWFDQKMGQDSGITVWMILLLCLVEGIR
jgi:hypothetical protein